MFLGPKWGWGFVVNSATTFEESPGQTRDQERLRDLGTFLLGKADVAGVECEEVPRSCLL